MAYPTTYLTIQDAVMAKLGLKTDAQRTKVKDWIQQAYAQIVVETEALQKDSTIQLAAGTDCYSLSAAIIRIKQIVAAPLTQPTAYGTPLRATSLEEILARRQSQASTTVTNESVALYALNGMNQLVFYPTPSRADWIRVWYVYLPTALAADADIPVLQEPYVKAIEYAALAEGADYLKHPDVLDYRALKEDWIRRFRSHLNRREGGPIQSARLGGLVLIPRDNSADVVGNPR